MAKEQEVCLLVLDELVKDYASRIVDQTTGAWKQCEAMRQALLTGDVDTGLTIMRDVCPAALEDVRVVFRAKKQKFVELLRSGGDPEAALACARTELAPLALDAYPEAYGEFKRLLLLLLLVPKAAASRRDERQQPQLPEGAAGAATTMPRQAVDASNGSGLHSGCRDFLRLGAAGLLNGADSAGLWDPASTSEFADMAYFTVRSMLGLQQPLLSLQLRFLLRLQGSYGTSTVSTGREGAAMAAELAPRLRSSRGAATGGDRDPAPLPPLVTPGGSGAGPPSFPESRVQAVIQGAGTSRAAAMDALKRSGGDALDAFKAEVGRLRLNEQLMAELALEYCRFRGLLSAVEADVLEARAAGGSRPGGCEPSTAAAATTSAAGDSAQPQPRNPQMHHPQQQQQQKERAAVTAAGPGRQGSGMGPGPGPLGLARGDATWAGGSPPSKVARRSPPAEAEEAAEGGCAGERRAACGQQRMDMDRRVGADAPGQPSSACPSKPECVSPEGTGCSAGEAEADRAASCTCKASQGSDPAPRSGSGSGTGSGLGASQQQRGQGVLSELLRLGQDGDAEGVLTLVESVDPSLWTEHPALLFDVRRCQYGKLLTEGKVTQALELARRELTPLANANPSLLPLLKSAMAALLPPLPGLAQPAPPTCPGDAAMTLSKSWSAMLPGPGAPAAGPAPTSTSAAAPALPSGFHSGSLLPSLPVVVGTIQAVLQPRLGLQGPRLIRLMEGLLASHRAWLRAEKMISDPFAEAMRISALRATPSMPAAAAAAAVGTAAGTTALARQQSAGTGAAAPQPPLLPPPPPLPAAFTAGIGAAARALERALRETEAAERGLVHPWLEMERQILAQMHLPFGSDVPAAAPGGLYGVFGGGMAQEDEHGGHGAAGGAAVRRAMAADDDDDDDSGGGGGGMDVDEEGVLRLMEILELPRGAAVELLQNHDGDVQAAVLSVMQ